jgi:hypothetical protein
MSLKDNIDFSTFTDLSTAFDLYSNSIRKAFQYDSYGNKTKFQAVVLTNPIPVSPSDLKFFTGTADSTQSSKISQFVYRARIIGQNSPHQFLPDPCNPTFAGNETLALKIIEMHTLFMSNIEFGSGQSLPKINSIVEVELQKNTFGYNIQYGKHIKLSTEPDKASESTSVNCDSLKSIMENATVPTSIGGSTTGATDLQNAYKALAAEAQSKNSADAKKDAQYVYTKLIIGLGGNNTNLVLGIMANAYAESAFKRYVVSGGSGESSLGLWQMNVGVDAGSYGTPNSQIKERTGTASMPKAIIIPDTFEKIPYFAGALMVKEGGSSPIGPSSYKEQDVSSIYNIATDIDKQIDFVIKNAKRMLSSLSGDRSSITAKQWADWWQIYFEQPGKYHPRGYAVQEVLALIAP